MLHGDSRARRRASTLVELATEAHADYLRQVLRQVLRTERRLGALRRL